MSTQEMIIVLVEDDEDDYLLTRDLLDEITQGRFELRWVVSYEEALEVIHTAQADVYLVDYRLGQHDGLELLREALSQGVRAPIIMLTGQGNREVDMQAMQAGAADYLVKGEINSYLLERTIRYAVERRQTEEKLRESEQRYRAIVEDQTELICRFLPDGTLMFVNEAYGRYFGKQREDLIGESRLFCVFEEDRPIAMEALANLSLNNPVTPYYEHRVSGPAGEVRWQQWADRAIFNEEGRLIVIQSVGRDVTERVQAEKALQEYASELAALYRATAPLLNPSDDLVGLAEAIAQAVTQEFTLTNCNVLLADDANARLKRVARAGNYDAHTVSALPLAGAGLTVVAFQTGEVVYVPDVTADPRYLPVDPRTRSELVIPLRVGGQIIGLLDLQSPELEAFNERARRVVATYAERAALALQNARLREETRQRLVELEAVARISTVLRTARTLDDMLPIALDQLFNLLQAEGAALVMPDPVSGELVIELARGQWLNITGLRLPANTESTERVLAAGQTHSKEASLKALQPSSSNLLSELNAVARIPLIAQEQVIGALWIGRKTPLAENEVNLLTAIADIAANAINRATLHEQTEQRLRRLQALRAIDTAITSSFDLRLTLKILLEEVTTQLGVHAAGILLLNPHLNTLDYVAGHGFRSKIIERSRLQVGQSYVGRAVLERSPIHIPDLSQEDSDFARASLLAAEAFVAYYGMPLISKGQVKGVLEIFHRAPLDPNHDWLDFLEALAGQAAIAMDNSELFNDLQRSNVELSLAYDATIEGWSKALDLRDKETEGHTQRVAEMTVNLAHAMGFTEAEIIHIRRGALLHDIGKMGVPDSILLKPGPLTEEEWGMMRRHTTYAYELLSPIAYLRLALDIPYCHHEKWDGTGYPRGLKGEQIPLVARLFAIVDVWDALRSDRPYRPAWPENKVLEHLRALAGTHLDPQVVEVFLNMLAGASPPA